VKVQEKRVKVQEFKVNLSQKYFIPLVLFELLYIINFEEFETLFINISSSISVVLWITNRPSYPLLLIFYFLNKNPYATQQK
jgi:hypothetical protein